MSKHLADKRAPSTGGRLKAFLRIAREEGRTGWHRPHQPAGVTRLKQFLRIERGQTR